MDVPALAPAAALAELAQPRPPDVERQGSRQAAEDFAAVLLGTLVKEMWKTVSAMREDGEEGEEGAGGPGGSIYQGLAQSALGDALARQGMHGLADRIRESLERTQQQHEDSA